MKKNTLPYDLSELATEYISLGCNTSSVNKATKEIIRNSLPKKEARKRFDQCLTDIDLPDLTRKYEPKITKEANPQANEDAIYGAIYGDIAGSAFEGIGNRGQTIETVSPCDIADDSKFVPTDDTVMTLATWQALKKMEKEKGFLRMSPSFKKMEQCFATEYRFFGQKYPNAGYGGHFYEWLTGNFQNAYGSCGNGSAMRISPIGASGLPYKQMIRYAIASSAVSHNHLEGIRGACVEAVCIWLATCGYGKDELLSYLRYAYSLPGDNRFSAFTYEEAQKIQHSQMLCQFSVPASIISVMQSESFEDAIWKAINVGTDTDTNACIAGAVAGAMYGVSDDIKKAVRRKCRLIEEFALLSSE